MKILVTAGATQTPIDQVRAITNIFKGKTGTQIAEQLAQAGHEVTLLTSNLGETTNPLRMRGYRTFDHLAQAMEQEIRECGYDVIIHSAAVSDYKVSQVMVRGTMSGVLIPIDASGKISGSCDKLYLELVPTFKIVDKIRKDWGFKGFLVKFKLQVGISDAELLDIARNSRAASDADVIVANCLEWSRDYAYVVGRDGVAEKVTRNGIAANLMRRFAP